MSALCHPREGGQIQKAHGEAGKGTRGEWTCSKIFSRFGVWGLGIRDKGLGLRIKGGELRVQGLGFRK